MNKDSFIRHLIKEKKGGEDGVACLEWTPDKPLGCVFWNWSWRCVLTFLVAPWFPDNPLLDDESISHCLSNLIWKKHPSRLQDWAFVLLQQALCKRATKPLRASIVLLLWFCTHLHLNTQFLHIELGYLWHRCLLPLYLQKFIELFFKKH